MTKTKENPTAAETVARGAKQSAAKIDGRGRRIEVQQLDALQYYRLITAMGEAAENSSALDFAMIAAAVRKIDEKMYPVPTTHRDVEFAIQQLDFDGIAAAGLALKELSTKSESDIKAEVAAAKN